MTTSHLPTPDPLSEAAGPDTADPDQTGPDMTEVINPRTGAVRVSGRLTEQGAELLRGTVETLHRRGHTCVVVDLHEVRAAEAAGVAVLHELRNTLAEDGGQLLVLRDADGASANPGR